MAVGISVPSNVEIPEMVNRWINRRLTFLMALGLVAGGGLAGANPAAAQTAQRFSVLIPPKFERQGDISDKFGKNVSKELHKLVEGMNTHQPVAKDDLKDALKRYNIDDDDLNCVYSQQLSRQVGWELVLCARYSEVAKDTYELQAAFISPSDQQRFDVPAITTREAKEAARHVFTAFEDYLTVISQTKFCMDDLGNENWDGALTRCGRALEIDPVNQTALYGKGFALMKTGRNDEALESLDRVLELNPMHEDALMAAGFLTARMGRMDASRDYYNQYLELNPGNTQVRLTVALDAAKAGNHLAALEIAEAGIAGEERDLTLVEYAGYFAATAAASIRGGRPAAQGDTATTPDKASLYEKALGYFDEILAVKGDSVQMQLLIQKLTALRELGRVEEAAEFGARATQIKPTEAPLWNVYAVILNEAGRVDEALAALDKVIELNPDATNVRALQGQWLLAAGELERAVEAFRVAIDAGGIDGNAAANQFLAVAVNDKYQKKQYAAMMPYLEAAMELASDERTIGMAHFFTGFALYNQGIEVQAPSTAASAEKALPIFRRALEHLEKGRVYAEAVNINVQQIVSAATQYVEIQEALIKRGL